MLNTALKHLRHKAERKNKLRFLSLGIIVALAFTGLTWYRSQVTAPGAELPYELVIIDGNKFNLEVADTPESRAKGLSGRHSLNDGEGMLFIFDQPGTECFWMKDVDFSIDILWFDADKKLIYALPGLSPATYPNSFCPPTPAKYVVELPAGTAHKLSIGVGDSLTAENL